MAVLSDKTIKERIKKGELVPNGNLDSATHCSYEFTAALMLRGGSEEGERILEKAVAIEPAQLVWIKAREKISMPANMVGVWIQTQALARQGLLLLNVTLIEPGYQGPLSAVLVNFGNKKVPIFPHTKIAKVMFLPLDREAAKLVENGDLEKYDTVLTEMAANAPKTFLQLQSFLPNIEERANAKLEAMDREIERNVATIAGETRVTLERDLRGDMTSFFRKWGFGLFAGFVVGCAAVWLVISTFLPRLVAEYSGVEELARKAALVQQAETITGLSTRLKTQATEIESLKKQVYDLKTKENKPQFQGNPTDTIPLSDANNAVPKQ
ncbi:MAG: dCTP deaminase domain-containing protein [Planctomycetota bacterium]|jgi:deoxycytidine triphosphate deaminase